MGLRGGERDGRAKERDGGERGEGRGREGERSRYTLRYKS